MHRYILAIISIFISLCSFDASSCTSAIAGASRTSNGRALLWKHRDCGTEHNFIERVPQTDSTLAYIALFNAGDSLLHEAWTGFNEAGLAIMNTASYNLAPDTARIKDREGIIMTKALQKCRTLSDFEHMLDTLPRPMGIQANFGLIDSTGNGAYYEADDWSYIKYPLDSVSDNVIIRTNYSFSRNVSDGFGYIRYNNACHLLSPYIKASNISPDVFTECLSRSFYHSVLDVDYTDDSPQWIVDQDFIPRYSSSASVVIEGIRHGEDPVKDMVMWVVIGYPPCSHAEAVTLEENGIPESLRPTLPGWRSPLCEDVVTRKHKVFPIHHGNGNKYINMDVLRSISKQQSEISKKNYRNLNRKKKK